MAATTTTIPEEVLKCRPCNCAKFKRTTLKNGQVIYRIYKYKSKKLASGKWSRGDEYLIGKVIPGTGFIPNKRYIKELADAGTPYYPDEITVVDYGQYALLEILSADVYEQLKKRFAGEAAAQIYCYALIMCANGFVHMDQVDEYYRQSFLSVQYRSYSFKLGYTAVRKLLHDLGMYNNPVKSFEQYLIDSSSKHIAIDGHVVRACSEQNDLAEMGYKSRLLKAPQVNILIAFDVKTKIPLAYRTYRGSSVDKSSAVDFVQSRTFTNTRFIVDRGFFSAKLLGLMSQNGNSYIIPVPTSNKNLKRIRKTVEYTSGEFVYKVSEKQTARVVYYEEQIDEKTRIIFFKDLDENNSKRKSYLQHKEKGDNGYTDEGYRKYQDWWGVYPLQTTTDAPAPEVFIEYKTRWGIETYNNYIKNDAHFVDLKNQDYYIAQGFDFIMLVTGIIHQHLNDAVKALNKPSLSNKDVLLYAGAMKMTQEQNEWRLRNTRKKDIDIFREMGFEPLTSYPLSDEFG